MNKITLWKGVLVLAFLFFSYLMLCITCQYIPPQPDVAFLRLKTVEMQYAHYRFAFFCHVYTSILIMLLGFFQFSVALRTNYPALHRQMGKAYVFLLLLLAGPTGLIMGYYANGGLIAQVSFCLLAICWMYFTYKALQSAKRSDWKTHRNYMFRSYALTLSAVSLRLFKWIIVSVFHTAPMDTYRLVAWLGWVVNWGIVELLIYYSNKKIV